MSEATKGTPAVGQTWRHYKGETYLVLAVGTHTETREPLVVYRAAGDPDGPVWVRPLAMWRERVGPRQRFEPAPRPA